MSHDGKAAQDPEPEFLGGRDWDAIERDVREMFRYREDMSYQARAHEYLRQLRVTRGYDDTAVLAVVGDIVERAAYAASAGGEERPRRMSFCPSCGESLL